MIFLFVSNKNHSFEVLFEVFLVIIYKFAFGSNYQLKVVVYFSAGKPFSFVALCEQKVKLILPLVVVERCWCELRIVPSCETANAFILDKDAERYSEFEGSVSFQVFWNCFEKILVYFELPF